MTSNAYQSYNFLYSSFSAEDNYVSYDRLVMFIDQRICLPFRTANVSFFWIGKWKKINIKDRGKSILKMMQLLHTVRVVLLLNKKTIQKLETSFSIRYWFLDGFLGSLTRCLLDQNLHSFLCNFWLVVLKYSQLSVSLDLLYYTFFDLFTF